MTIIRSVLTLFLACLLTSATWAQAPANAPQSLGIDPAWAASFHWRSVGPAVAGGRILRIVVVESDPRIWYVSTASGGVWKTMNNGVTFAPLFQQETSISIGDIAIAQSNPDVVWVGTGENNPRNSVS